MAKHQFAQLHPQRRPAGRAATALRQQAATAPGAAARLLVLQNRVGNRGVQRLLAQRAGAGPFTLDDETAQRIDRERSSGRPLDSAVQTQMGEALGTDFSTVRVHTSPAADELNRTLNARAFTTGQDIFFRGDAYQPTSSSGQQLIAHELTHVVQQATGAVGGSSGGMTVNAPGDRFEQEADAVAGSLLSTSDAPGLQRQVLPEDEEETFT